MRNKIAILYSGFMSNYLNFFIDICNENNIKIDLLFFENNKINNQKINKSFILTTKYKPKKIKLLLQLEKEIKNIININDYDYILSDCIGLSFGCNIFHNISLREKINLTDNFIYKKILELGHYNRLKQEKGYYKNCQKIFVVSNYLKNDYHKNCNIDLKKINVIYPGTNNKNYLMNRKINNEEFTIGAVTCGFKTKGGYNILGAIKRFIKKYPNIKIKVKIINPKFKKFSFLNLYLKLFKIDKIVEIIPYQKEINEFYKTLDCLICASNYEAFGRVVTESMLVGLPVIVASNIGASDIIKDGENGFIFNIKPNKYENLADKIKEVFDKKENLEELVKKSIITAKSLKWENFAKNLFNVLYSNLLN